MNRGKAASWVTTLGVFMVTNALAGGAPPCAEPNPTDSVCDGEHFCHPSMHPQRKEIHEADNPGVRATIGNGNQFDFYTELTHKRSWCSSLLSQPRTDLRANATFRFRNVNPDHANDGSDLIQSASTKKFDVQCDTGNICHRNGRNIYFRWENLDWWKDLNLENKVFTPDSLRNHGSKWCNPQVRLDITYQVEYLLTPGDDPYVNNHTWDWSDLRAGDLGYSSPQSLTRHIDAPVQMTGELYPDPSVNGYDLPSSLDQYFKLNNQGINLAEYMLPLNRPNTLCVGTAQGTFHSGGGTDANPYVICNRAQFEAIRNNLNSSFILGRNINYGLYLPHTPFGTFNGRLDGNWYKVYNMTIEGTGIRQGLFTSIGSSGEVLRLRMRNVTLDAGVNSSVGAIAGQNNGLIEYSSATGPFTEVRGAANVGGLVGENFGQIWYSHFSGTVSGTADNVGGLVGRHGNLTQFPHIEGSYATFETVNGSDTYVHGYQRVGGLIGNIQGSVSKSYAATDVTSTVGGGAFGFGYSQYGGQNPVYLTDTYIDSAVSPPDWPSPGQAQELNNNSFGQLFTDKFNDGSSAFWNNNYPALCEERVHGIN